MTGNPRPIVIFGTGTIAEVADYYFSEESDAAIVAFTADRAHITAETFRGRPVVPFEGLADSHPADGFDLFIAAGYQGLNKLRAEKFAAAKAMGYRLASFVSPHLYIAKNVAIGENCLILENQTVQAFCRIGDNVTLWSGNHIGHHSVIEDHVFISSHVVVSGNCRIGAGTFMGVNATVADGCRIGAGCFVAMGAGVAADMADGTMALGTAAEIYPADDRRTIALKRRYFGR